MKLTDFKGVKLNTLTELETFFFEKKIPQEKIRFFVNEDRRDPKCFGIYQDVDSGNFIVYKNKADGSRYIRYNGPDEAQAVHFFFSKLKEEMNIRDTVKNSKGKSINAQKVVKASFAVLATGIVISAVIATVISVFAPKTGYYYKDNNWYAYHGSHWYYYSEVYDDWYPYYESIDSDYYYSDYISDDMNVTEVTESDNYIYSSDSDYSGSDFDDYDWGGWDSSDTDWDSDW